MPPTPSSTVFARYPAALSLPTADPSGLAVEVMLRFAGVRASRRDARLEALSLTIHEPGKSAESTTSAPEICTGLMPCLKRLSSEEGVTELGSTATTEAMCVEVLTTQCIFPAFNFIVLFDPLVYRAAMAKSVEPKVATFWEGITGSYRDGVLRRNPYFYTGTAVPSVPSGRLSLVHLAKLREVGAEVDKAFAALESLCVSHGDAATDTFFMGTTKPTYIDALVYAAASSFFHAGVGDTALVMKAHQQRLMEACPRLLKYTERLRHQFFEADSGTYCLKPRSFVDEDPGAAMAAAAELHFRKGRLQTLIWTGVFASVYFVLANADMVVALLEAMLTEEAEELAEETAAAEAETQLHDGASTPREPREL
jgi:hypothetical protein